ncbi:MAG: DoxX family membrane protein [Elusimicrobia bacterium]|nr:DoxX family membrane protein [Elusimicrobiota bacterium]
MTRRLSPPPLPQGRPWTDWLGLTARVLVGATLAFSGAAKASAPAQEFAAAIEAYALLPQALVPPLATLLPWAEVLAGFALVFGWLTRWSAAAGLALFSAFITALLSTFSRGFELADCGCFGFGLHLAPGQTIFLDAALAGCCLWLLLRPRTPLSLDSWITEGS